MTRKLSTVKLRSTSVVGTPHFFLNHVTTERKERPSSSTTTMAEDRQPASVVEGAQGDVEDEVPAAKSAEDRKAAAALSKLDANKDDDAATSRDVDQDAVNRAMSSLAGGDAGKKTVKKEVKKVKVDAADVALLVSANMPTLDLSVH
jgi:hypothetical protein